MTAPILLWFRDDLRLGDNAALHGAARAGAPVLPVYVLDEKSSEPRALGGAARWWLHGSLAELDHALRACGSRLVLRRGAAEAQIAALAAESGAHKVHWSRPFDPQMLARDARVEAALRKAGVRAEIFPGNLLIEPRALTTKGGEPFKVFTPFWKALRACWRPGPRIPAPEPLAAPQRWPESDRLGAWALRPTHPDWAGGFRIWRPGEAGAQELLVRFLEHRLKGYARDRNRPDLPGTSRLSPHLRFGEISAAQVWRAVEGAVARGAAPASDGEAYLRELGWREFCSHLLFHFPDLPKAPWRAEFGRFPWRDDPSALKAWRLGQTGYPVVDAGMRELWATGWMHNRVRMIVASFLTKHLLIPWQEGEAWFWDTLVDADVANNAANWQWVAGSGADAAPYFRIFNPVLQGERFDPEGEYVRRWVPELERLPSPDIQRPWTYDRLRRADVVLGTTYPEPIVDHLAARRRALEAYARLTR